MQLAPAYDGRADELGLHWPLKTIAGTASAALPANLGSV